METHGLPVDRWDEKSACKWMFGAFENPYGSIKPYWIEVTLSVYDPMHSSIDSYVQDLRDRQKRIIDVATDDDSHRTILAAFRISRGMPAAISRLSEIVIILSRHAKFVDRCHVMSLLNDWETLIGEDGSRSKEDFHSMVHRALQE